MTDKIVRVCTAQEKPAVKVCRKTVKMLDFQRIGEFGGVWHVSRPS